MPLVTVILTSYNLGKFLRESIDSVLRQTFQDFELIIWDDASSDDSWEIISSYADPRIRVFQNECQRRAVYGINRAIAEFAQGKYIAIHNSDDVWESEKLENQVRFLDQNPAVGAVFTRITAIGESGTPLDKSAHFFCSIFDQPNRTRHEWLRFFFYHGNALCHPSALVRRQCYHDVGLYRSAFAQLYDFDMWVRIALRGYDIHLLPEKLFRFRIRDNEANVSGNRPETRIRNAVEAYDILKHFLRLSTIEEIAAVFPGAQKYHRGEGDDPRFVLAMMALDDEMKHPWGQLFGVDLLLELFRDDAAADDIERFYGFSRKDLIALTGKFDVFAQGRLPDIERKIQLIRSNFFYRIIQKLRRLG